MITTRDEQGTGRDSPAGQPCRTVLRNFVPAPLVPIWWGLFVSRSFRIPIWRDFSTGTVPQICHCPVALSPGPGANPGDLRDQDRDPDIVPGQPQIPDHNCRFVDHLRSSYFQNTKLISGAMSKIIAVFVFVTFIGAIFVGVFISG